jgi:hypothetical protein
MAVQDFSFFLGTFLIETSPIMEEPGSLSLLLDIVVTEKRCSAGKPLHSCSPPNQTQGNEEGRACMVCAVHAVRLSLLS